jgi:RNA polymerase sigma-70 factor (ECF subfamily)
MNPEQTRQSFEMLYDEYSLKVSRYLRNRLPSFQDVEDVTQTVFLELFARMNDLDKEIKSPSGLIFTIAQRRSLDYFKSADYAQIHIPISDDFKSREDCIETISESAELTITVREALKNLPEISMSSIVLRYYKFMSIVDIATELVISEGAAKKRVFDAREILKEILSPVNQEA